MKNAWTFSRKLSAGFALIVSLSLVMLVVAYAALHTVVEEKDRVIFGAGQALVDASRLQAAVNETAASVRAHLLTADERYLADIDTTDAQVRDLIASLEARAGSEGERVLVRNIEAAFDSYTRVIERVFTEQREGGELVDIEDLFRGEVLPRFEHTSSSLDALLADSERRREQGRAEASETAKTAMNVLLVTALGVGLSAFAVAFGLSRALTLQIGSSVHHIRSSAAELQAAASQQASGAREQATAMTEISTTIGELLATSRQIAEGGQAVASMATNSAASAQFGQDAILRAQEAVFTIRDQVDVIVQHMLTLGKRSQQIGGILEIINELTDQTNILAINAMIEAAGAGEAGRRFSVVGDEIRRLSDRVGTSSKEIRVLIEEIRASVNATVMATEAGSKSVGVGSERFDELKTAFVQIGDLVGRTTEAGREIQLSTKQQATAVEQVNVAISNVAQATKETEMSSAQTLATASQLSELSDALTRLVRAGT